jgi:PTH1 family peptidyl-tRNA hydrolase
MNLSGLSIREFLGVYDFSLQDLLVVHDDMDLNFGMIRIKAGGGDGGHRGVQSITQSLGGSGFVRLKVGIGRPEGDLDATGYVLRPFARAERVDLERTLLWAVEAVETILVDGVERAMNVFNGVRIGDNEKK